MNDNKLVTTTFRGKFQGTFEFTDPKFEEMFLKEIWTDEYYFKHGVEIKEGDKVLDIGGHIGMFAILADKLGASVWAFEPVQQTYNRFLHHLVLNKSQRVQVFHGAVIGKEDSVVTVNYPITEIEPNTGRAYVGDYSEYGYRPEKTKAYNINTIIEEMGKVDVLKLDCEGSEYEILMNINADNLKLVDKITMEFHRNPQYPSMPALDAGKILQQYLQTCDFNVMLDWSYGEQGRIVATR